MSGSKWRTASAQNLARFLALHNEQVLSLFRHWDIDGNGALDKKEVRRAAQSLGFYASKEDVDELFELADHDHDGSIAFGEMKHALNQVLKNKTLTPRPPPSPLPTPRASPRTAPNTALRELFDWDELEQALPTGTDFASLARRRQLWQAFDMNGNGLLSLAEFDRGLQNVCASALAGSSMSRVTRAKPAIARAFHAARLSDQRRGANRRIESTVLDRRVGLNHDHFVGWAEFRMLLLCFRSYLELWLMFEAIDTGGLNYTSGNTISDIGASLGDRRITFDEFERAVPHLERWAHAAGQLDFSIDHPGATFAELDVDGSGGVRFDEFAQYALRHRLVKGMAGAQPPRNPAGGGAGGGADGTCARAETGDERLLEEELTSRLLASSSATLANARAIGIERRHDETAHLKYMLRQRARTLRPLVAPQWVLTHCCHRGRRLCGRS